MGLLARHGSGCRANAIAAVKGWRERLKEERIHLRTRLAALEANRDRDREKPQTRRRYAVATRKAETRLARVQQELRGQPRHCFGGRRLLRQGRLGPWRARRAGNALFAGETGKKHGNDVARWDPKTVGSRSSSPEAFVRWYSTVCGSARRSRKTSGPASMHALRWRGV